MLIVKKFIALLITLVAFFVTACGKSPESVVKDAIDDGNGKGIVEFYKKTEPKKAQEVAKDITLAYEAEIKKIFSDKSVSNSKVEKLANSLADLKPITDHYGRWFGKLGSLANTSLAWQKSLNASKKYAQEIKEKYGMDPRHGTKIPEYARRLDCYITNVEGNSLFAYRYKRIPTGFTTYGFNVVPTSYDSIPDPDNMIGVITFEGKTNVDRAGNYIIYAIEDGTTQVEQKHTGFVRTVPKFKMVDENYSSIVRKYYQTKPINIKEALERAAKSDNFMSESSGGTLSKGVAQDVSLRLMKNERNLKRLANEINGSGMRANQIDDHEFVAAPRDLAQRIKNEVGDGEVHELCDIQLERVQCMVDGIRGQKERFKEGGDLYDKFYAKYKEYCDRYDIPYNGPNN